MALKNQDRYLPAFKSFSERKGYTFDLAGGYEKAFEYCVLEYSFSFWQWRYVASSNIPGRLARPIEVVQHMNRVAGFDYFSDEFILDYRPHFYQALTETGYYGFELEDFGNLIRHVDNPTFSFTLPDDLDISYSEEISEKVYHYLKEEAENFIFIYGEYDTWSATCVNISGNPYSRVFVKKEGCHRTRINNMPEDQRLEIYNTLARFLE